MPGKMSTLPVLGKSTGLCCGQVLGNGGHVIIDYVIT